MLLGPVLIDFPIDILFRPVLQNRIAWGSISSPLPRPPGPDAEGVSEAVALWKEAKRPAIIVSTGARSPKVRKITYLKDRVKDSFGTIGFQTTSRINRNNPNTSFPER
jgi:thiamine pyrophosphate-dependent acetolactate synthase large subunit-like protein